MVCKDLGLQLFRHIYTPIAPTHPLIWATDKKLSIWKLLVMIICRPKWYFMYFYDVSCVFKRRSYTPCGYVSSSNEILLYFKFYSLDWSPHKLKYLSLIWFQSCSEIGFQPLNSCAISFIQLRWGWGLIVFVNTWVGIEIMYRPIHWMRCALNNRRLHMKVCEWGRCRLNEWKINLNVFWLWHYIKPKLYISCIWCLWIVLYEKFIISRGHVSSNVIRLSL